MKKINNKGFLMVETLVVATFTLTVLVILFLQFKNLVNNYNNSYNYNTVEGIYNLNSLKKYIKQNNIDLKDNIYLLISNGECGDFPNKEFCTAIALSGNFKTIILTSSDTEKLKNHLKTTKDDKLSEGMKDFIRQINSKQNRQRLIAEFNDGTYATIVFI